MPTTKPAPATDSNKEGDELILIDGYGFLFRAYHSMPPLTRPGDGTPVGAIYGFSNMLMKLLGQHQGDYVAVALDSGKKTFRNDLYGEYKANRPPPPEDLIPQFPMVREAVEAFNLPVLEKEGYEADDLIATYTRLAREQGLKVIVVSSDKDLMQLVGDGVEMFDPLKSRAIKEEQVQEKFGVTPDKVLDVLSLMGDSSDNIPGVPGIGPKTAAELIGEYGNLDTLLARANEIKQNKRRENLIEFADQARLSRDLVKLEHHVPTDIAVSTLALKPSDNEKLASFLSKQGFKSLVSRLDAGASFGKQESSTASPAKKKATNHSYSKLEDLSALKNWLAKPLEIVSLSVLADTNKHSELQGFAFCLNNIQTAYIASQAKAETPKAAQNDLFSAPAESSKKSDGSTEILKLLKPILENDAILKTGQNIKPLLSLCKEHGITPKAIEDVSLLSYLLEGTVEKHDIQAMAMRHLDAAPPETNEKDMEADALAALRASQAGYIANLYPVLKHRLREDSLLSLYERIERPLVAVLAEMERVGIKLDCQALKGMSDDFAKRLHELEKEVHELAGYEFNIGSPKQLGEVLFEKMGIQGGKKSKTGAYGTDASKLEELAASGHSIADKVLAWRQISKLKSTYTDALPKQVKADGRVHTHYEMTVTNTGRLSSTDPNLQNIPTRTEEGTKIREAFIAKPGYKLISADYSQIELRLIAHMADIKALKDAFAHNQDIHATTASQVFGIPLEQVDAEHRRRAKAINFGIIYGMSTFGLASRLRIERTDAKRYIETYFKQYPGIRRYMDDTIQYAKEHGYVQTLFGRKCFIRDIQGKNPAMRQFAERAAINAPLQGTGADIIKKAMVQLPEALQKAKLDASLLLQVHDELILEVKASQAEQAATLVKKVMEGALQVSVPLTVDVGVGDNWAEIH